MAEKEFFTQDRRSANVQIVTSKLEEIDNMDFNSIIFTFADIINSSFLNGMYVGKSKEERAEVETGIMDLNNQVIDVLNANDTNMMHDMVVLSNLLMDAIETATQAALSKQTATEVPRES